MTNQPLGLGEKDGGEGGREGIEWRQGWSVVRQDFRPPFRCTPPTQGVSREHLAVVVMNNSLGGVVICVG